MAWIKRQSRGKGVSLLVPYRAAVGSRRYETWEWLKQYWAQELPDAQVVVSDSVQYPFSKTEAINAAAVQASGDIFVILDADCYIPGAIILDCAKQIREHRKRGFPLWFMPYRHFFRLTDEASRDILNSDPTYPLRRTPTSKEASGYEGAFLSKPSSVKGNWYGALIQIMPREAFFAAGMMDERFSGWGGEDVSFMHAVDTIYGRHKTTDNAVIHLWHPNHGSTVHNRVWDNQEKAGTNSALAWRYGVARGDKDRMQGIVDEHKWLV